MTLPEPSFLAAPGGQAPSLGETLAWLDRHVNLEAIESGRAGRLGLPTLERIQQLLAALGDPQQSYPALQVTGTNGKGSTSRMCASILEAEGITVGTYTSPHLGRVNERIEAFGAEIDDGSLVSVLGRLGELEGFLGLRATWFELMTAAALTWFADVAVDAVVAEVGMGGRWDATNVVRGEVAAVTNVDLDHTEILGSTRETIADEKAGIVKSGSILVLGETTPSVAAVFEAEAERVGAAAIWRRGVDFGCESNRLAVGGRAVGLWTPFGRYEDVLLPLHGSHQGDNAACALAAAQAFVGSALSDDVVRSGLGAARVPGRLEVAGRRPLVVLDGAHNPAGARALGRALAEDFAAPRRIVVVLGCLGARDPAELLSAMGTDRVAAVVACRPPSPRAKDPLEVARAAETLGLVAEVSGTPAEALERALEIASADDLIVVTGSLYVVGAARAAFQRSK